MFSLLFFFFFENYIFDLFLIVLHFFAPNCCTISCTISFCKKIIFFLEASFFFLLFFLPLEAFSFFYKKRCCFFFQNFVFLHFFALGFFCPDQRADAEILMDTQPQGAHEPRADEEHIELEILRVASLPGPR